jgi:hypothetical protein
LSYLADYSPIVKRNGISFVKASELQTETVKVKRAYMKFYCMLHTVNKIIIIIIILWSRVLEDVVKEFPVF